MDRAPLRFLDADALARFLAEAGFVIDAQQGGWHGEPVGPTAPEIITFARTAQQSYSSTRMLCSGQAIHRNCSGDRR